MEQAILEILKEVGVYDQARKAVSSDEELIRLFHNDFGELVGLVSNKRPQGIPEAQANG